MKIHVLTALVFVPVLGFGAALAQSETQSEALPDGTVTTINGVETACTGTTLETRANPKWRAYPLHIEFAGKDGQYLGDEQVTVTGNGQNVSVHCEGPWVLMKLPSGAYHVSADVADAGHKDLTVHTGAPTVVSFNNAGGEVIPGKVSSAQ
jgi:hypothetical protein